MTATASSAYSVARGSAAMVPCRAVTARMARMPTGIPIDSCRTIAEPRSARSTAKGAARSARVMAKTIARATTR